MQKYYLINTTLQSAQLKFDVTSFDGMTHNHLYGGITLLYTYHTTDVYANGWYRYRQTDFIFNTPDNQKHNAYGPYCTRMKTIPLVGAIDNIYLSRGVTRLALYALPPFFNISLVIRVVSTPCEGVTNLLPTHCDIMLSTVVTAMYVVKCRPADMTSMVLSSNVCVVVQHMPLSETRSSRFSVHSSWSMRTKFILVHHYNLLYWEGKVTCVESLRVIHLTTRNTVKRFHHTLGQYIGVITKSGINNEEYDSIKEVDIYVHKPCMFFPKLYFQIHISNIGNKEECFYSEMGVPPYSRNRDDIPNQQPVMGGCAMAVLKTFKGLYNFGMIHSIAQVTPKTETYHYYIMWSDVCETHEHVNIFLSYYVQASYLLPTTSRKLIFSRHSLSSILEFNIMYSKNCEISVAFNGPSMTHTQKLDISKNKNVYRVCIPTFIICMCTVLICRVI